MAAHTRLVRLATWLTALCVGACTEDFDSFEVKQPDAAAGGAQGGAAGQAGATSTGGQPGNGGQPGSGGTNAGGFPGQGGASGGTQCKAIGEQCHGDTECCEQHCIGGWNTDDRDCNDQDKCVACSADEQCPSGRCDNCVCEDKLDKGASCNEDSDCKSNNCSGMKCG